jgi:hypothetical protein
MSTADTSAHLPLRNDHNVYILGAGFSRDAHLPLISDFLLCMRDSHEWLLEQKRTQEAAAVEEVLKFRLNAASAAYWVNLDLENIEELFSLAAASQGDMDRHIRTAIAATIDFARLTKAPKACTLYFKQTSLFAVRKTRFPQWLNAQPADNAIQHDEGKFTLHTYAFYVARLLGMFRDGKPTGQNTFITFNYDTLLEEALVHLKLPFHYGFPSSLPGETAVQGRTDSAGVPVLKLHGSVNWARQTTNDASKVLNTYSQVLEEGGEPDLIAPTWNKRFGGNLRSVWETAVEQLSTGTRIIIIGFSMPPADMHFKYLLAAGLQRNLSLRQVVFVNPDSDNLLEQRARSLLREAYIKDKRIDFIKFPLNRFTAYHPHAIEDLGRPREHGMSFDFFG